MDTTEEAQVDKKKAKIGFFKVSLSKINEMLSMGARAPEIMVYLILSRGQGNKTQTKWSFTSCKKHTEFSYPEIKEAFEWLESKQFIKIAPSSTPKKPNWAINKDDLDTESEVALSNQLIDGVGAGSKVNSRPMSRLSEKINIGYIGVKKASLDALILLLNLYRHQDYSKYSGLNPKTTVFRKVSLIKEPERVGKRNNTYAYFLQKEEEEEVYKKFIDEAMFYITEREERSERFWLAFNNLKRLGWLYETLQIWTDDFKNQDAEPLYTLYIFDRHTREAESEWFVESDINTLLRDHDFFIELQDGYEKNNFATLSASKNIFPVCIFRLKFKAGTRDNGIGASLDAKRNNDMKNTINSIF